MVQTKSSRGQCHTYVTDAALVLSVSVCFKSRFERLTIFQCKWGVILVDYAWSLKWLSPLFLKKICHEYTTLALEIMKKQPCNPVKHSRNCSQKCQLVFHGVTCHPKRHSVLCASELLIINGCVVCVVWFMSSAEPVSVLTNICWEALEINMEFFSIIIYCQ